MSQEEKVSVTQTELYDYSTQVAAELGYHNLTTVQLELLRIAAGRLSGFTQLGDARARMALAVRQILARAGYAEPKDHP